MKAAILGPFEHEPAFDVWTGEVMRFLEAVHA